MALGDLGGSVMWKDSRGKLSHATGVSFSIEGINELIADFNKLGEEAIYKLRDPSIEAANIIMAKAKEKTHDITGELDRGLKVTKPSKNSKKKYRVFSKVSISKSGAHGVPVELGHRLVYMGHKTYRSVKERPFLRPAADESKDEVMQIMINAMNALILEANGR